MIFWQALEPMWSPRNEFHSNLKDEGDGPVSIYRGMPLLAQNSLWLRIWYCRAWVRIFNPRTDGGDVYIRRSRRFFVDSEKPRRAALRNLVWLFLHPFYTLCTRCDLIPWKIRSPGQFKWNITSPFCHFETASEPESMTERFESCSM